MATHSSVLAWRIPGTAEPGGLPSMGSHRVGHDWSDLAAAAAGGSVGKNLPANAGNVGSIPGSGRSPGEGNGNPLQHSCLENPRDGGAWWAAVYGVVQSRTQLKRLSSSSSMAFLVSIFWKISILFSIVASPIYIPNISAQGFSFSVSSLTLVIYLLSFDNSHSARCELTSHCGFDLHVPDD